MIIKASQEIARSQHGDLYMPRLIISKHEATSDDTIKNINSDKTFQFKKMGMIYRKLINFPQNNTVTQDYLHVLSLIISQSFVALWPLPGVEDTFGIQQEKIKGQKNSENNGNDRLPRCCSIVMCLVLTSSTPRSLRE